MATTIKPLSLDVSNLSWHCGSQKILDNIQFSVAPGRVVGVLGPNGVGKSSLLRCIYRYLQPCSGEIILDGMPIQKIGRKSFSRKVAVVLQQMSHEFDMSVQQMLATGLLAHREWWNWNTSKAEADAISNALQQVGLLHKAQQLFSTLSGGEMQRLLIARALLQQPGLLLLDEPTNHLDVRYQIEILQLVRSLGTTVIATIHDLNLAAAFCDDLLLMEHGGVAAFGTPEQVLCPRRLNRVYGVNSQVDLHPEGDHPRITFHYDEEVRAIA